MSNENNITDELPKFTIDLTDRTPYKPGKGLSQLVKTLELSTQVEKVRHYLRERFKGKNITFIVITKGGLPFGMDLYMGLKDVNSADLRLVGASHYKNQVPRAEVEVDMSDVPEDAIKDQEVVLVEDIIATGDTVRAVQKRILDLKPKSLTVCCVLRNRKPINEDIKAIDLFQIPPDLWVAGYGLDGGTDREYRHLNYIVIAPKRNPKADRSDADKGSSGGNDDGRGRFLAK
jgi:hypoxanthine phosphoribosyltransferase